MSRFLLVCLFVSLACMASMLLLSKARNSPVLPYAAASRLSGEKTESPPAAGPEVQSWPSYLWERIGDHTQRLGAILAAALFAWALCVNVPRSYHLIYHCSDMHGGPIFRRLRALSSLKNAISDVLRDPPSRNLFTAARLRIEVEILNPRPVLEYDPTDSRELRARKNEAYKSQLKAWKSRVQKLCERRIADPAYEITLPVHDPGVLVRQDTEDRIQRYFRAVNREKQGDLPLTGGGIDGLNEYNSFLTKITIEEGFLAPLHLLAGLISHFDEDWAPVLANYPEACENPSRTPLQVFLLNCWLLWGPSIPLCTCEAWKEGLTLQYGYGDENNSILVYVPPLPPPLDATTDKTAASYKPASMNHFERLQLDLQPSKGTSGPALGVRTRVTGRIRWARTIPSECLASAQHAILEPANKMFVLQYERHMRIITADGEVEPYYYTAYIWVLFEIKDPLNNRAPSDLLRVMSPFEHVNIADKTTYEFGKRQLARKFLRCVQEELRLKPGLKFRYVCAFDDSGDNQPLWVSQAGPPIKRIIGQLLKQPAYAELKQCKCITINAPRSNKVSSCTLPKHVTKYYNQIDLEYSYRELSSARADLKLLKRFYKTIYKKEFSDQHKGIRLARWAKAFWRAVFQKDRHERLSLRGMKSRLKNKDDGLYGKDNYHVFLLLHHGRPIAASVSHYVQKLRSAFIELILVDPHYHRRGLGARLLRHTEKTLKNDALGPVKPLLWIFARADSASERGAAADKFCRHCGYININGFSPKGQDDFLMLKKMRKGSHSNSWKRLEPIWDLFREIAPVD